MKKGKSKDEMPKGDQLLINAIEELRSKGVSVATIAEKASVAPAAVVAVRTNKFGPSLLAAEALSEVRPRQWEGWAETLLKIAAYVRGQLSDSGITLEGTLREFGIDPDMPTVRPLLHSAGRRVSTGLVTDVVLKRIAFHQNDVAVGILRWPPFFEEGEELANSWAWSYTKRLVGSINPVEWSLRPVEAKSIDEAMEDVGTGKQSADLVFGVYDTSYRRLKGVSFIHLPGIGVPLGIIRRKNDNWLTWETIAALGGNPRDQPVALVMEHEVGHLFLRGNCQFAKNNVVPAVGSTAEQIATELCDNFDQNPDRAVIFCADRTMCRGVLRALRMPSLRSRSQKADFELMDTDHVAPIYRLGMGVRADATEWIELLRDTQTDELFRNTLGQTARDYASLLARSEDISLLPLEPDIPRYVAAKFAKSCLDQLGRLSAQNDVRVSEEHFDRLVADLREIWLGETEGSVEADLPKSFDMKKRRTVA